MDADHFLVLNHLTLLDDGQAHPESCLALAGEKIVYAGPYQEYQIPAGSQVIDASGQMAAPGYIDLQLNGAYGADFTTQPETISRVAARLPETGVTSFLPTFITSPLERYPGLLQAVQAVQHVPPNGARVLGAHLEGPFLEPASRGAHNPEWFREPTQDNLIYYRPLDAVQMVTMAVERPGGIEAARWLVERGVAVSFGHSAATSAQAEAGFAAGVHLATHLYNAMPPLYSREPGLVGFVLTTAGLRCGLIVDGVHCHPRMVELAFRCKGPREFILVTDAIGAMGMPPGEYTVGEQKILVDATSVRTPEGRLAGSILTLDQAVRNLVAFTGCTPAQAVRAASLTPAEALGIEKNYGRLLPGYQADLVLLDAGLKVKSTLVGGVIRFSSQNSLEL